MFWGMHSLLLRPARPRSANQPAAADPTPRTLPTQAPARPARGLLLGIASLLIGVGSVGAASSDQLRHAAATNQIVRLAQEMSSRCLEDVSTLRDWEQQRPALRQQLRYMLGVDPLPKRSPLKQQVTGTLDTPAYRIEKFHFQSLPGLYVTGNFYVSKSGPGPLPTILYLCGHSAHALGAKTQYQERILWYAEHGYNVLILDTLEFGEVAGIHHGTHNLNMWNWLSLGYTPAGTEVWNAMRALDWLETRPEVDMRKIGLTGISGGGAMTWYVAALDERIAAAAPSCSTFTFGSQATHWLASGQCDCIYYHNTYIWDFPVVAALIAPRPLMITSGQRDTIFPPDGYHEVFRRASRVYDLFAGGTSDRLREVDADVGHSDPPLFLHSSRQWMNRWLKGKEEDVTQPADPALRHTPSDLRCVTEAPTDAANYRIQNELTSPVQIRAPRSRSAWEKRQQEVLAGLRERVFRWFPAKPASFQTTRIATQRGYLGSYCDFEEYLFDTEPGVQIKAQLLTPKAPTARLPLLVYVERPGDTLYPLDTDELLPLLGRAQVLILNPRFTEVDIGSKELTDLQRTAAWIGRTLGAMQVWDILRTIDWALTDRNLTRPHVILYAKGEMAAFALHAAALEPRVTGVILNQPPASHWQGAPLLNVLRVTDLPEIAGLVAPRPLRFLGEMPASYDLTQRIFHTQRAERAIRENRSLPEALGEITRGDRR